MIWSWSPMPCENMALGLSNDKNLGLWPRFLSTDSLELSYFTRHGRLWSNSMIWINIYIYIYIQGWFEVCAQPMRDGVTALLFNDVSHWLVASLDSSLYAAHGADGLKPTRLAGHWFRYHHWDINIISNTCKMFPNRLVVGKRTGL